MLISLQQWNNKLFSGKYTENTLRAWARNGNILPEPKKIGRDWWVDDQAYYLKKQKTIEIPKNIELHSDITDPLALKILNSRRRAA